jgi:predicted transcriptional regulator
MKNATLPAVRVSPSLRKAAEKLLRSDETLSRFVEEAVQRNVERRQADAEFVARGLRSEALAKRTGRYKTPVETLAKLEKMTAAAPGKKGAR